MRLSDALVIARKRGRGVKRRFWSWRSVVIAWDDIWYRERLWENGSYTWQAPAKWTPSLEELVATDWETCRP